MAYITKSDLLAFIDLAELDRLIDNNDANLADPIKYAEGRVRGKLEHKYDVSATFSALDTYTNIKEIIVHIALFNIYDRVGVRHVPENRVAAFERAERDIYLISTGEWSPNLPTPPITQDEDGNDITPSGSAHAQYDNFIKTGLY